MAHLSKRPPSEVFDDDVLVDKHITPRVAAHVDLLRAREAHVRERGAAQVRELIDRTRGCHNRRGNVVAFVSNKREKILLQKLLSLKSVITNILC
jgi:hypothetical protein